MVNGYTLGPPAVTIFFYFIILFLYKPRKISPPRDPQHHIDPMAASTIRFLPRPLGSLSSFQMTVNRKHLTQRSLNSPPGAGSGCSHQIHVLVPYRMSNISYSIFTQESNRKFNRANSQMPIFKPKFHPELPFFPICTLLPLIYQSRFSWRLGTF